MLDALPFTFQKAVSCSGVLRATQVVDRSNAAPEVALWRYGATAGELGRRAGITPDTVDSHIDAATARAKSLNSVKRQQAATRCRLALRTVQ
jgi:DNA-binding CsgD family transcriptional regulator